MLVAVWAAIALGATGEETQARIAVDIAAGRPVVVHVIVALCDNEHQGIVPVPAQLGNGQDPRSNLYWGALYGVRTYLAKKAGWTSLPVEKPRDRRILDHVVYFDDIQRAGKAVDVYIVAEAWDGAEIEAALERLLALAGGILEEVIAVRRGEEEFTLATGGSAHLVAFVGHNGFMDVTLPAPDATCRRKTAGSSIVLACASKSYFLDRLRAVGSHPLLLTTGRMAPEAYTLDAAIRCFVGGGSVAAVREDAAAAYDKFQKCGLAAARNLFWGESQ